ncbi:MAG TPA: TasA family protein [Acidimicrobiales bacterium]|nr:TasA family protein [Acidimicrobiales bacterium]
MHFARRRIMVAASAVTTLAAASSLVAGTTFGFYSSKSGAESNSFTSGTVTLASTVTGACTVVNMAPGDSPAACGLGTTYSGSLSAYLAVDVVIETQAGTGGTTLYNPAGSNGLTVTISDNQTTPVTYVVPSTSTTCPGGAPTGSTCYELDNELLGTSSYANGAADTISTAVTLPSTAGNIYQGGAAQVILTAHAVQAKNNTVACSSTATAGHSCTPSGTFAWS